MCPCLQPSPIAICRRAADRQTGVRNGGLLPFQLSTDFINNYRRLYGPVQLTSLTAEVTSKAPRSPVEPKHFKGNKYDTQIYTQFSVD